MLEKKLIEEPNSNYENEVDYGPPDSYSEPLQELQFPEENYYCVLAGTPYCLSEVYHNRKVPVVEKFSYTVNNYHNSFLFTSIEEHELQNYLNSVSEAMQKSISQIENPYTFYALITFLLSDLSLLIGLILKLLVSPYFMVLTLTVALLLFCLSVVFICKSRNNDKNLVKGVSTRLPQIVHQTKHFLTARGILVRPGNYGAFLMLLPLTN